MSEILQVFGIQGKVLLFNFITFALFSFALYKILYNPILNVLEQRKKKIEKSLDEAKAIELRIAKIDQEIIERMEKSKEEAIIIVQKAKKEAEEERGNIRQEAKQQADLLKKRVEEELNKEKKQLTENLKDELLYFTVKLVEKILKRNITEKDRARITEDLIQELKNRQ